MIVVMIMIMIMIMEEVGGKGEYSIGLITFISLTYFIYELIEVVGIFFGAGFV